MVRKCCIGFGLFAFMCMAVSSCLTHRRLTHYPLEVPLFFPPLPDGNKVDVTYEAAELGRHLFYDPILSADSTVSCASCHRQEVAFSDAPNRFSKGIYGQLTQRNTMPLYNLVWNTSLFWDGKAASIESQVFHPVSAHNEMALRWTKAEERINDSEFYRKRFRKVYGNITIDSTLIANTIAQFERTLVSNNSKYDRVLRGEDYFSDEELAGFVLMNDQTKGDCLHCHTTDADALGTTGRFSNNGLEAVYAVAGYTDKGRGGITGVEKDMGLFRIPSLRNVALTAPYMHDGRFATLDEVLDFYSDSVHASLNIDPVMASAHRGGVYLSEKEKGQIKIFLLTFTDSVFIANPAFSNPFLLDEF